MTVRLPASHVAGDSFALTLSIDEHPAGAGWSLHLRLVPRAAGGTATELTAVAEGDAHRFSAAPSVTATWSAGPHSAVLWAKRGVDESVTLQITQITVLPDPRSLPAGADTRSQARKALDDLHAALAAWNPLRKSYSIGGRSMEFNSVAEILKLISHWETQLAVQERPGGGFSGARRRIFTRL